MRLTEQYWALTMRAAMGQFRNYAAENEVEDNTSP